VLFSILGYEFEEAYVQEEVEEPSVLTLENPKKKNQKEHGNLPGFRVTSNSDYKMERLLKHFKIICH
jgi:G patch domain-containing protein 1